MDETIRQELEELHRRLTEVDNQLRRLLRAQEEHGRLPPRERDEDDEELARLDRVAYIQTMRQALYRALYIIDFTLIHERIDRMMLRDARTALVDGVDAADACLMLDGVSPPPEEREV